MKVVNAAQMQAADAHAIHDLKIPSIVLMENAASRVAEIILAKYSRPQRALIVCGKGNNGGDGMATARLLKLVGWDPLLFLLGSSSELKADPAQNWTKAIASGVRYLEGNDDADLHPLLSESELIIDAMFGTGLTKPLEGLQSAVVQKINRAAKQVVAIDLPSGLSSDTGELLGPAIRADVTVALAALKYSHVLPPASKMCGEIHVVDIGIPVESTTNVVRARDVKRWLPHRSVDSHKGSFGHAVIVGGSTGKSGAPYMSGKAALRAGAGLVTVVAPSNVQPIIAALGPEVMTLPLPGNPDHFAPETTTQVANFVRDKTAVAIGPGMGTEESTLLFFQDIVRQIKGPVVIDADGLNLLAQNKDLIKERKPHSTILTPHPGEMARLTGTDTMTVQKSRTSAAQKLAEETGSIIVLKGYRTVVAEPGGAIWINLSGGSSLSSAGTGDILTGLITGFLAQKLRPIEAAISAVYCHGLAANLFEGRYPQQALNAMDVLDYWNQVIQLVRSGEDLEREYLKVHIRL